MTRTTIAALFAAALFCAGPAPRLHAADAGKGVKTVSQDKPGKRWVARLGLSAEASAKLEEAFKADREAAKPLRRELRDAMQGLRDLVEDKAADKDIQAALDRVAAARKALQAQREKFQEQVAAMLTPTQRAKLMLMRGRATAGSVRGQAGGRKGSRGPYGAMHGAPGMPERDDDMAE